ncbi:MAG: 16S rRNA (adenine(1518)-N(6)/adenine(1519)-N(6))-dimethyltransferase RsmA [Chloroflexi bacterium]|nr:16S rRNA (adenine(1518)-N(6)/adenine(1519)-N(6))-dimethyltransferase RsmA [Chloroflexota bacterium]
MVRGTGSLSVKGALERLGLSARKALGQHFLVSVSVLWRILQAAELGQDDTVVEVGPGLGVLTRDLLARAQRVVAVELDAELASALQQALAGQGNLRVVCADARTVEVAALVDGAPYKLVANMPYYAASPILRHFLEGPHPPTRAVVMVQREVAQSMAARPGEMSVLSVAVQLYGSPRIVASVPRSAFYPQPKVTSAIVRIDVYPKPALDLEDREAFFRVVRAGFSAPRKQLRNSLAQGLGLSPQVTEPLLARAGIDSRRRPETLTLEEWERLFRVAAQGGDLGEARWVHPNSESWRLP